MIAATFNIDPAAGPAVETCVRPLAGVGHSLSGSVLSVEVFEPFGSERLDQVRAIILGLDPTAAEAP